MTPELTVLVYAALLQIIQYLLLVGTALNDVGMAKLLSSRDPSKLGGTMQQVLGDKAGRASRALNNHFEGLILFAIAAIVLAISNQSSGFTATCAWIYLIARILYVPAYYFDMVPWRTVIWGAGFAATVLMLLSAL